MGYDWTIFSSSLPSCVCFNLINFNLSSALNPFKATLLSYVILRGTALSWPLLCNETMEHSTIAHRATHSKTQPLCSPTKILLIPPPLDWRACGKTTLYAQTCSYLRSPALSTEFFQHSDILFVLPLDDVDLATDYGTVSWPVTPDVFISVTSHFLECPLKVWFVESGIYPGKAGRMPSFCSGKSGWTRSLVDFNCMIFIAVQK